MTQRIDYRVSRTRKSFQESLLKNLMAKKFDAITISDISKSAGYNRVTFYSHYQDKYELLEDLITEILDGIDSEIQTAQLDDVPNVIQTQPSTIAMFQYIYKNLGFFQLMLSDKRVPGFIGRFIHSIYKIYEGHVHPENNDIEQEIYLVYVTGATFGVISYWVTTGFKYSPIYMAEQLTQIVYQRPQKVVFKTGLNYNLMKIEAKKVDKRIIRTRENFKNALINLVCCRKFESITITDLCIEAKYNRAAFYSHYENKIDLANEIVDEVMENLMYKMSMIDEEKVEIDNGLSSIIFLFTYIKKHKKLFELMLNGKTIPGSLFLIRGHLREFYRKKIEILNNTLLNLEREIFLSYITSATLTVISNWIYTGAKQTPTHMAEQLYLILNHKPILK